MQNENLPSSAELMRMARAMVLESDPAVKAAIAERLKGTLLMGVLAEQLEEMEAV